MKKIIFVLLVLVSSLFISCQAKYKEVVLDDGTVVYTLESDDVDSERVKRIFSKSLKVVENSIDDALESSAKHKEFEDEVSARMEQTRKEMDSFTAKYFPEVSE